MYYKKNTTSSGTWESKAHVRIMCGCDVGFWGGRGDDRLLAHIVPGLSRFPGHVDFRDGESSDQSDQSGHLVNVRFCRLLQSHVARWLGHQEGNGGERRWTAGVERLLPGGLLEEGM